MYRKDLEQKFKDLYLDPEHCEPLVQVRVWGPRKYTIAEQLASPEKAMEQQLLDAQAHIELGDDWIPALRANFGTAQIAASFGCEVKEMEGSLPACKTHILEDIEDVHSLKMPTMKDGMNEKVLEFEEYFMKNKPSWIQVQHPDVQSAFNSAHLIRGNDIIYDFYDSPDETRILLNKITDFMLTWIKEMKKPITDDAEWFYDSAGLWKGAARTSNCSLQLLSPDLYREFIKEQDERFLRELGGGRVHYCGEHPQFFKDIFDIKSATNVEVDSQFHHIHDICNIAPKDVSVSFIDWSNTRGNAAWLDRLLEQGPPQKRNILIQAKAQGSMDDAKRMYEKLKKALDC